MKAIYRCSRGAVFGIMVAVGLFLPGLQRSALGDPLRPIRTPVRSTLRELQGVGDLNGDGIMDVVIVDKQTGVVRIGYGEADGGYVWGAPVSAGVTDSQMGMAIGYLRPGDSESIALTGPSLNRVQVLHPGEAAPQAVVTVGIGSADLVALPDGENAWDELYVASHWNNVPTPFQVELKHGTNRTHAGITSMPESRRPRHLAGVPLKKNLPPSLAMLQEESDGMTSRLVIYSIEAEAPGNRLPTAGNEIASLAGLPRDNLFDFGFFAGSEQPVFILRDGVGGVLRLYSLSSMFAFSEPRFWNPGVQFGTSSIQSFAVLRGENGDPDQIVISFSFGPVALAIFSYSVATDQFTLVSTVDRQDLPEYQALTGLLSMGTGGDFVLLTGEFNGVTTAAHRYSADGTFMETSMLPAFSTLTARANVFLYDVDPSASSSARLVGTRSVADWTTGVSGFPADMEVNALQFGTTEEGLIKDSTIYELGAAPIGVGAAGVNQLDLPHDFAGAISMASLTGTFGEYVETATPVPEAGRFAAAVRVEFQVPDLHHVFYRSKNGFFGTPTDWLAYNPAVPIYLVQSSSLEWYSQRIVGNLRSPIGSAYYEIESTGDSNDDGIPDIVRVFYGLDPNGNWDTDGDGVSDLIELLRGFDPHNPGSYPQDGLLSLPARTAYTIVAEPMIPDYDLEGNSVDTGYMADMMRAVQTNTVIHARRIGGGLITDAPVIGTTAHLGNVGVDSYYPMVLVGTPVSYSIIGANHAIRGDGREMIALVSEPPVQPIAYPDPQNYAFMDPASAAAAWISDMQLLLEQPGFAAPAETAVRVDHKTTMAALILEHKVGSLRGIDKPTLFASRSGETNRTRITSADLAALQYPEPWTEASVSYDMAALHDEVLEILLTGISEDVLHAREWVGALYAESMKPDMAGKAGMLPIDNLRKFIAGEDLPDEYTGLIHEASARVVIDQLLQLDGERVPVSRVLAYGYSSMITQTCTILEDPEEYTMVNLMDRLRSGPYRFPPEFPLVPGMRMEVTGYLFEDPSMTCWGSESIAVTGIRLLELPVEVASSGGGALLPSSWEQEFLGSEGNHPFSVVTIDGLDYQLLQLYLDGADPMTGAGATEPEDLRPVVKIELGEDGTLKVYVEYPSRYAAVIRLVREETDDLMDKDSWQATSIAILTPDGRLETEVDLTEDGDGKGMYFRYRLELP